MHSVITNSGVTMPKMIYGTAWKKERTADLVELAVKNGFSGIDTACQPKHYHEAGVGEALARLFAQGVARERLFLQTKFTPLAGQDPQRIPYDPQASLHDQVHMSFAASQRNLGVDYIDSYVLHSPLFPYRDLLEVWRAMEHFAVEKQAGQLGISNCYELSLLQRLCDDARIRPAVVQNRFYADTGYDRELRMWCQSEGIIYQSFWTLSANPHLLSHPLLFDIARKEGIEPTQVLYMYAMNRGITVLNGTTDPEHMKADISIVGRELERPVLEQIDRLLV